MSHLDIDEVECIRKALINYRSRIRDPKKIRDIDRLLGKVFLPGQPYVSTSKNPFGRLAPKFREVLKEALDDYRRPPAPSDDAYIVEDLLKYL